MAEGREEQTQKSISDARAESVRGVGIKPEEARKRLEDLGYKEEDWVIFTAQDLGSHYMSALAHIAKGSEPRVLEDVYKELFPDKRVGKFNQGESKLFREILDKKTFENPVKVDKPPNKPPKLPENPDPAKS